MNLHPELQPPYQFQPRIAIPNELRNMMRLLKIATPNVSEGGYYYLTFNEFTMKARKFRNKGWRWVVLSKSKELARNLTFWQSLAFVNNH